MAHESYMLRCLQLAQLAAGHTAPNPMVGAVLVHHDRIIGEGYHQEYGQAHAEVNCLNSVPESDRHLIPESTIYVSLEPCAHYGKTPPCADRIISEGIGRVVIGTRDPFGEVNGKGIEKLKNAGINVVTGVLEKECREMNKRFFTFHEQQRPYVILKWAQTANGFISGKGEERLLISNSLTQRLVHQWRGEEAVILVGTRTALLDDPALTNRFGGPQPLRAVVDLDLKLPGSLKLLDSSQPTLIFNTQKEEKLGNLNFLKVSGKNDLVREILKHLYTLKKASLLVEGGAALLGSFIQTGAWDEARVITNDSLVVEEGTMAPIITGAVRIPGPEGVGDRIEYFKNSQCYS
ncbi:MAG: bifunctional diaminohydroxyphosphoribosylaminopyrimidine deaminase/5-amino-6-(5-phosphoribosylamino)uracil reductase RibD [Chitinophagaceae bacterium]|nr:bifunctional diaminohydroxyphosphoribosylaminopyrimidine deaminase/5-amino-6-(5-phosphoribosylamino)uracil reductase RibD [Chitinophagaceae bacterium]